MIYSIFFHKKAENQFKKLDKKFQERITSHLDRIKIRPHHFVKRLVGVNYYALRVGNYRLILDIVNKELVIIVIEIGLRKNIYKEL